MQEVRGGDRDFIPLQEANKKEQKKVLDEPVEDANLEKTKSEEEAAEKLAKAIGRPKKQ